MKKIFYLSAFCVLALAACTESFKKGDNGLYYKIIASGNGNKLTYGNYVQLHVKQIYGGTKDTIIGDSRDFMPRINILDSTTTPPEYFKILKQARNGDSIVLRTLVDSFYKNAPKEIPAFMKKGNYVYTCLKIINVFNLREQADSANKAEAKKNGPKMFAKQLEQIEKELINKNKAQLQIDDKIITDYLTKNNIKATKTKWGTYITTIVEGVGDKLSSADVANVKYTGQTLDSGKVFDSNIDPKFKHLEPYPVSIGHAEVMIGWLDALLQLKKGSKATIYIPSTLAYGIQGNPSAGINPNAILKFDIDVVSVNSEEELLAKQEEQQRILVETQKHISDSIQKLQPIKK